MAQTPATSRVVTMRDPILVPLVPIGVTVTAGVEKAYFRMPWAFRLVLVKASLFVASTSGALLIDMNKNGSTILTTKLMIDQDEKTSLTATIPYILASPDFLADDEVSFDVDSAGTGAAGLTVCLLGRQT